MNKEDISIRTELERLRLDFIVKIPVEIDEITKKLIEKYFGEGEFEVGVKPIFAENPVTQIYISYEGDTVGVDTVKEYITSSILSIFNNINIIKEEISVAKVDKDIKVIKKTEKIK